MCQIRHVAQDRIALEVRAGLFEISDPEVAKRLLMPSIKKSRLSQLKVGWSGVGRRIREVRGFDMTQADFAARRYQPELPVRDGAGPSGDWGGDLAESRKGGGTRDDLKTDRL